MQMRSLILVSAMLAISFAELVETDVKMVTISICVSDKFRLNQVANGYLKFEPIDDHGHGSVITKFYDTLHAEVCHLTEMYIKNLRMPENERKEREKYLKISYRELFGFAYRFLKTNGLSLNLRSQVVEDCGATIF